MATKLHLMRHGETLFNIQGRVQGACDPPLADLGTQQALLAKDYFNENSIWFDSVYSSTQERATDTAKLVPGQPQVTQLKGIKETNFGESEAQPGSPLPKLRAGANLPEDLLVPFGGEDIVTVGKRGLDSIFEVLANNNHADNILMVSRGAMMWGVCPQLGIQFPEGVGFSSCAICEFQYRQEQLELQKLILPTRAFKTYSFERE